MHSFGQILTRTLIEVPFEESYWQYKLIKRDRKYPFYYSEEEVKELEERGKICGKGPKERDS